jgi:hypothetical protein
VRLTLVPNAGQGCECSLQVPVSPSRVFDASLVPETCLEFPAFASLMLDSIRQAKADMRNGASCPTVRISGLVARTLL